MAAFLPEDAAGQDKGSFPARLSGDTKHRNRQCSANMAGTPGELHQLGCPQTARDAAGQDCCAPGSTDLLKSKIRVSTEAQTG